MPKTETEQQLANVQATHDELQDRLAALEAENQELRSEVEAFEGVAHALQMRDVGGLTTVGVSRDALTVVRWEAKIQKWTTYRLTKPWDITTMSCGG